MRVTLGMLNNSTINYLDTSASNLQTADNEVSSGKQISEPSDNPVGTGEAMRIQSTLDSITQYTTNTNQATSQLNAASSALQSVISQIQQLQTVATSAANTGASDSSSTNGYLAEIQGIQQSLVSLAGTKYGDSYLFSGFKTDTNPLAATNGSPPYTYQGDDGAAQVEIQQGQKIQTNVTADNVFNLNGSAGAGSKDIFYRHQQPGDGD